MSNLNIEKLEKSNVKLTFEIDRNKFDEGIQHAYNTEKSKFKIDGFRAGKAPKAMIEKMYGKEVFYDGAIDHVFPEVYANAIIENKLDVVAQPLIQNIDVQEDKVVIVTLVVVKPEFTLGEYKGLKVDKVDATVTDEDVENELNRQLDANARVEVVTRAIENGDIANIDFKGFKDGVPFEGGEGVGYDLNIGSKTFIDTFEEQLVGKKAGEEVKVNVTFPENYGQADLAGQPAVFEVKVNEVKAKIKAELNDEFAKEVSEFETLADLKADIKTKLVEPKEQNAKAEKENNIMEKLIAETTIEVPNAMVEQSVDGQIREFDMQLQRQGISLKDYLQFMGQDVEAMRSVYRVNAEKQVRGRLILEKVAETENFEIADSDVDAEIERIGSAYGMPVEELKKVMRPQDIEDLKHDLKIKKALDLVVDTAVEA